MGEIEKIIREILKFRNERDWEQYHTGKDLAICLNIESSELLENFLWKSDTDVDRNKLKDELADVLYSAFLLAAKYDFNIKEIVLDKLEENKRKYPVNKAMGSNKKYDKL